MKNFIAEQYGVTTNFQTMEDQCEQLILRIKESLKFAIQLDDYESTDITTKMAHLLAYVWYNCYNIYEDLQ